MLTLFGDSDWLRPHNQGADKFVAACRNAGVGQSTLETTANAGHHLYMDNAASFNAAVSRLHV
eukprot:gene14824-11558_t